MKSFQDLFDELSAKKSVDSDASGTSKLLDAGVHAIGKKVVEEAAELWMAAEHESDEQVALEASQLIYYIQLILISRNIPLKSVEAVL
ncbi:MAG: phosphoribosyl-ATP diphosphatase [Aquiluna sp.]|nr:phosphoribosyl-ATP diphosphatase [Aquiluna sp.]